MGFSTKVKFMYDGEWYVGRICEELEDNMFSVITTGKNGKLWTLSGDELKLA